jgi:hypothetical protein
MDQTLRELAAAQSRTDQTVRDLAASQSRTEEKLQSPIDAMRRNQNGHAN